MSIDNIKRLLDIPADDDSYDEVVGLLLQKNQLWIRGFCGIGEDEELCGELAGAAADLCVAAYNRLGSEGFSSETIGSVKIEYAALSDAVKDVLVRHRRLKF